MRHIHIHIHQRTRDAKRSKEEADVDRVMSDWEAKVKARVGQFISEVKAEARQMGIEASEIIDSYGDDLHHVDTQEAILGRLTSHKAIQEDYIDYKDIARAAQEILNAAAGRV